MRLFQNSYIGDKQLTQDAFDEEGYFKTGDLAILKNGEYIFAGRASNDCKFYQYHLRNREG